MTTPSAGERVAELICHLTWCAYQLGCGQPYNEQPTEAQLDSQANGYRRFLENPRMTPEDNHNNWMAFRSAQGWKYGPVKNEATKEHPDLVPFSELPLVERNKDIMDLMARRAAQRIDAAIREARLEEAKWWKGQYNAGNGLCPTENNCFECNEMRPKFAERIAAAKGR